jgi:hypothetical protein
VPEVPAVPGNLTARASAARLRRGVADTFAPDGAIARALPGFEARDAQLKMAAAVAEVFADGGVLLA